MDRMSETVISVSNRAAEPPYPARAVAWYATGVLAVMGWFSTVDRFIISLLVGPIKRDLGLTDVQFGLLNGFAFAVTFCLLGLVAGALADRFSRRWVIFAGVSIWSVATAACGVANNFWHLLVARVGVGAGEAALTPSATSMLTDLFPRERLTTAMATYNLGATVGFGCAYLVGGLIVGAVSNNATVALPLLGDVRSWQAVFYVVGVPGALLSLLIFTVPEPARRGQTTVHRGVRFLQHTYLDLLRFMRSHRAFFAYHYAAFALASGVISGCGAWYPAHMSRSFGWTPPQIGLTLGLTLGVASSLSMLLCGRAVGVIYRRGLHDAQFRWYAGCLAVATPFGVVATSSANPWVFVVCLNVFIVLVGSFAACAYSSLNLVTPNQMRGTGVAFFSATAGLAGSGLGPLLVAAVSDHVFHRESAIGLGMAVVMGVGCPSAALLLLLGCRPMRAAMAQAAA
jgi:MFS family permease